MIGQDERIRREVLQAVARLGETSASCSVEEGHVILEGVVTSDERSYQLEAAARGVPGVRLVTNDLMVDAFAAAVGNVVEGVDLTPDFTADVGTSVAEEAVSEAEPYFPPTDPVVKPGRTARSIQVLGGFAATAEEETLVGSPPAAPPGDEELRETVLAALHRDASTTDLDIDVEVQDGVVYLRGTVPSLDDADLAESVASRVPGVEEVEEDLRVQGL